MNKTIIYIGFMIILIGVLWPILVKLPFGKLPGDIAIKKDGFQLYFPITSMIVVSLIISLIAWFLKK